MQIPWFAGWHDRGGLYFPVNSRDELTGGFRFAHDLAAAGAQGTIDAIVGSLPTLVRRDRYERSAMTRRHRELRKSYTMLSK